MTSTKTNICLLAILAILCMSCHNRSNSHVSATHGDTLKMSHAQNITIVRCQGYDVVTLKDPWNPGKTLHTYILAPTAKPLPAHLPKGTVIGTPIKRGVFTSTPHVALAVALGAQECVKGVCDPVYIHQPWINRQLKAKSIADCGQSIAPDIERIINTNADALFISPFQNSGGYGQLEKIGVPIIEVADYMETSALGRAEWVIFYGMLMGKEKEAKKMFETTKNRYQQLKSMAQGTKSSKSLLMDMVTGSVWYVPGGNSTVGQIIRDARANYPFAATKESGSLALSLETVLSKGANADVWMLRYDSEKPMTISELKTYNKAYAHIKATTTGQVYGCNTHASTYYEETSFRPDILLRDFVIILHPELRNLGQPKYFIQLKP